MLLRIRLFISFLFIQIGMKILFIRKEWKHTFPYSFNGSYQTIFSTRTGLISMSIAPTSPTDVLESKRQEYVLHMHEILRQACKKSQVFTPDGIVKYIGDNHYVIDLIHATMGKDNFSLVVNKEAMWIQVYNLPKMLTGISWDIFRKAVENSPENYQPSDANVTIQNKPQEDDDIHIQIKTTSAQTEDIVSLLETTIHYLHYLKLMSANDTLN